MNKTCQTSQQIWIVILISRTEVKSLSLISAKIL